MSQSPSCDQSLLAPNSTSSCWRRNHLPSAFLPAQSSQRIGSAYVHRIKQLPHSFLLRVLRPLTTTTTLSDFWVNLYYATFLFSLSTFLVLFNSIHSLICLIIPQAVALPHVGVQTKVCSSTSRVMSSTSRARSCGCLNGVDTREHVHGTYSTFAPDVTFTHILHSFFMFLARLGFRDSTTVHTLVYSVLYFTQERYAGPRMEILLTVKMPPRILSSGLGLKVRVTVRTRYYY